MIKSKINWAHNCWSGERSFSKIYYGKAWLKGLILLFSWGFVYLCLLYRIHKYMIIHDKKGKCWTSQWRSGWRKQDSIILETGRETSLGSGCKQVLEIPTSQPHVFGVVNSIFHIPWLYVPPFNKWFLCIVYYSVKFSAALMSNIDNAGQLLSSCIG